MYYVYSKRFQPFNKLNEEEIVSLATRIGDDDKIIIGVVNYNPSSFDPKDNLKEDERFEVKYNPLSYWERFCQINTFLANNRLLKPQLNKVVAITPLPRPSVNLENAFNFLPQRETCYMCVSVVHDNDYEERKLRGYQNQNFNNVLKIESNKLEPKLKIISPELIFCLMACGVNIWEEFVDKATCAHLKSLDIINRLALAGLNANTAREKLNRLHRRSPDDEKELLGTIISRIDDYSKSVVIDERVSPIYLSDLLNSLFKENTQEYVNLCNELGVCIEALGEKQAAAYPLIIRQTMWGECLVRLQNILVEEKAKSYSILRGEFSEFSNNMKEKLNKYMKKVKALIDDEVKQYNETYKRKEVEELKADIYNIEWEET